MKPVSLVAAAAATVALLTPVVAVAATSLSGPSTLKVQQKLEYRATGLKPEGEYSLIIRRLAEHKGRTYRCAAHLSAPRTASGTERFFGSVPTHLQCVAAHGTPSVWQPRTFKGLYRAVACVDALRNHCDGDYAVASKRVRIT
jgi:hypothetical protein